MLESFPDSYDNFLTSLNARSADDLDWENVKGLLIEEYMKRTEKNEKQESNNALFVMGRGKSSYRGSLQPRGGAGGGRDRRFQNFNFNAQQDFFVGIDCNL